MIRTGAKAASNSTNVCPSAAFHITKVGIRTAWKMTIAGLPQRPQTSPWLVPERPLT